MEHDVKDENQTLEIGVETEDAVPKVEVQVEDERGVVAHEVVADAEGADERSLEKVAEAAVNSDAFAHLIEDARQPVLMPRRDDPPEPQEIFDDGVASDFLPDSAIAQAMEIPPPAPDDMFFGSGSGQKPAPAEPPGGGGGGGGDGSGGDGSGGGAPWGDDSSGGGDASGGGDSGEDDGGGGGDGRGDDDDRR